MANSYTTHGVLKGPFSCPGEGWAELQLRANADVAVPAGHTTKHIIFRHLLITWFGLVDRVKAIKEETVLYSRVYWNVRTFILFNSKLLWLDGTNV